MNIARESAGFAGRRNSISYKYRVKELEQMFKDQWLSTIYLPEAYAATMGDVTISARFKTPEERNAFFKAAFQETLGKDQNSDLKV